MNRKNNQTVRHFSALTGYENHDILVHNIQKYLWNKHQYKAWVALERSLGVFYNCSVYTSSGGKGDLSINGLIYSPLPDKESLT